MNSSTGSTAVQRPAAMDGVVAATRAWLTELDEVVAVSPGVDAGRPVIDVWVSRRPEGKRIPSHCHGVPVRLTCLFPLSAGVPTPRSTEDPDL
ncbi:hypothetical protein AB5J62_24805 [Amycolatopsis sp. cg5]|uniref:hypothetical protein n=1 Tax=Amycolatopsis sp. cg5 TaxID=3238802 RepID=UPI003524192F